MASKLEALLRVMADLQQFSGSKDFTSDTQDELSEEDLDFVAAAARQPGLDEQPDWKFTPEN